MGGHTKEPLIQDGASIYAVYETGEFNYEDGVATPEKCNRFSLTVQHVQGWSGDKLYGCSEEEAIANAHRFVLAWNACAGLSDAALEQDIVAKVRSALAPFAFRTSQRIGDEDKPDDYKIQAVISMGEIRAIRAALSLLSNKEAE